MSKKNILIKTNILVCLIILAGFLLTAILSYRANYSSALENVEQITDLTSEGIYYQLSTIFTKPVNVSLTMANDSFLKNYLAGEAGRLEDDSYICLLFTSLFPASFVSASFPPHPPFPSVGFPASDLREPGYNSGKYSEGCYNYSFP